MTGLEPSRVICDTLIKVPPHEINHRRVCMLGTVLLVILILLLIGALPTWPHSISWGYGPSGLLGTVLIIILILLLLGRI